MAQVGGPVSSYSWHLGEAGKGEEWIASFKTTSTRYSDLEAHIVQPRLAQTRGDGGGAGDGFHRLPPLDGREHHWLV